MLASGAPSYFCRLLCHSLARSGPACGLFIFASRGYRFRVGFTPSRDFVAFSIVGHPDLPTVLFSPYWWDLLVVEGKGGFDLGLARYLDRFNRGFLSALASSRFVPPPFPEMVSDAD